MTAEHSVNSGIFHAPGGDHTGRAAVALLVGLEKELDRSGKFVPAACQQLRRAQQGGGVEIVAAGVHDPAGPGGVGQTRFFGEGQGVDIRPETDGPPRCMAPDDRNGGRIQKRGIGDAQGVQAGADEGGRAVLTVAQLRKLVEGLEDLLQGGGQRDGLRFYGFSHGMAPFSVCCCYYIRFGAVCHVVY